MQLISPHLSQSISHLICVSATNVRSYNKVFEQPVPQRGPE